MIPENGAGGMKVYQLVTEEVIIQVMGTAVTLKAVVEVMDPAVKERTLAAVMEDILEAVMEETLQAAMQVDMGQDLATQVGRQLAERLIRSMDPQGAELIPLDTISTKTTTTILTFPDSSYFSLKVILTLT